MPETASVEQRDERRDPRIEHSRRVIGEATLVEFAEHGFAGMTIEGVAARAGVGKSTIYRHWRTKLDLVDDALRLLPAPVITSGDGDRPIVERVTRYLVELEEIVNESQWGGVLPAMVQASEAFDDVAEIQRRFGGERRALLVQLLAAAVEREELSADVDIDILARCLVGPIFVARLMQHERVAPDVLAHIAAQQLGLAQRTG